MAEIRTAYVLAATSAVALMHNPKVGLAWSRPSALTEFTVGGLAGHLGNQLVRVEEVLADDGRSGQPISLLQHYVESPWVEAGLDHESNVSIRQGGESIAACGPAALAERLGDVLRRLTKALPAEPADRAVTLPWAGWALTLDDFLLTRLMEITVHCDDLASSVGLETPEFPPEVIEPVVDLLARLAVHRHGATAVIRTLSRAERAPSTISAF
jgi:hypothetical protein